MPILKIITNLKKSQIPCNFVDNVIPVLANAIQKPAERVICTLESEASVSFGGNSKDPAAVASLESIGHVGPPENLRVTQALTAYFESQLKICPSRFLITFYDMKSTNVAKCGTTADKIS